MISKGRRLRCAQPSRLQSKGADTSPQPKQTNKSDLSTGALTCEDDRVQMWDEVNLKCSAPGQCTSSGSCSGHILHCDEKLWRQTSWRAFDLKHCLFFYLCFRPQHSRGYFPKRGYWICYFSELTKESSMHLIMSKGDPARSELFFFQLSSRHILAMSKISLFPCVSKYCESKTVEMEDVALAQWLATAIRNMREKPKKWVLFSDI